MTNENVWCMFNTEERKKIADMMMNESKALEDEEKQLHVLNGTITNTQYQITQLEKTIAIHKKSCHDFIEKMVSLGMCRHCYGIGHQTEHSDENHINYTMECTVCKGTGIRPNIPEKMLKVSDFFLDIQELKSSKSNHESD